MTPCEPEILAFLREQDLPEGETAYRPEDCAYLVTKTIEELQEKIVQLDESFEQEMGYLEYDLIEADNKQSELLDEITNLEDKIKDLDEIVQASEADNLELRTEFENELHELENKNYKLSTQVTELEVELEALQDEKDNAITRLQEEREGNNYA